MPRETTSGNRWRGWAPAGAVTLLGLALRLLLWGTQSIISVDGTAYIWTARSLAGGPAFDTVQPPGYPLLIALAQAVARDWVLAARLTDLVAGTAMIPLTYALARLFVRSRWIALAPAAAVALMPLPVRYSLTTMSEAPYLAVLLAAFLLVGRNRHAAGGLVGGLAYLIRPEALVAVGALALFRIRRPRAAAAVLAGAGLVVGAFVVAQGIETGVWSLSRKSINVGGAEWWQNEPRVGGDTLRTLGERLEAHGEESLTAYPRRAAVLAEQVLRHGGWVAPVAGLLGLAGPAGWLGAGLVVLLVTPVFALGGNPRFILPLLPFLWILAGAALVRWSRPAWRWGMGVLCVLGLAAGAFGERRAYTLNEDGVFPELVAAGEWLRPHVGPETVVYDRKPYAAFHAGARYRAIPLGGYDEILDAVVAEGGDFLIVAQAVVDFFRPALLPLVLDKGVAWNEPRLAPVYLDNRYLNRRTLIFRVVRPGGPAPLPSEQGIKEQMALITHQENHYVHGILAMRGERWQVAAGEFQFVINKEPENAAALNNRAWCLLMANRVLAAAEEDARKAVSLEPENPDYLDTLIELLQAQGKEGEVVPFRARLDSLDAARGSP